MYEYRKLTPEQRQQLVEERLAKGYPPHQPPHPMQEETYYLLTAVCYEHQQHVNTTLNYIHFNPVKHGLVQSPYDWQWSSVHWYKEHYGRDWLRDTWRQHPIHEYGKDWDDI